MYAYVYLTFGKYMNKKYIKLYHISMTFRVDAFKTILHFKVFKISTKVYNNNEITSVTTWN